jgi:hypothetical protein
MFIVVIHVCESVVSIFVRVSCLFLWKCRVYFCESVVSIFVRVSCLFLWECRVYFEWKRICAVGDPINGFTAPRTHVCSCPKQWCIANAICGGHFCGQWFQMRFLNFYFLVCIFRTADVVEIIYTYIHTVYINCISGDTRTWLPVI